MLVAITEPLKPALQEQPEKTLAPALFAGQTLWAQLLIKKGVWVVGVTAPERPGKQAHPLGTLMPVLLGGQLTAAQRNVVGNAAAPAAQAGVELDVGAKPGIHCGATAAPCVPSGQLLAAVAPPTTLLLVLMQLPFPSVKSPISAQAVMADSRFRMVLVLD